MSGGDSQQPADIFAVPRAGRGMRVGLFGGSFNPPHAGHRLVALQVMKRLGLDALWVLVSPGNPLKDHSELAPLAGRVTATRALIDHPRVVVSGFEAARNFRYTYQTLRFLKRAYPGVRFVWIMGADALRDFHRWERWQDIAAMMPIAVYQRPASTRNALLAPAAQALAPFRIPETEAGALADCEPPAWVFLHGLVSGLSSSLIRERQKAGKAPAGKKGPESPALLPDAPTSAQGIPSHPAGQRLL